MQDLLNGLKGAAEATRLRILGLLASGELTVSDLVRILRQSQPRVSRHLKLLAEAGLVERLQEGAWAFYRLADRSHGGRIARSLVALMPDDDPEFCRDIEKLNEIKAERAAAAEAYFRANAADWDRLRSLYVPEEDVERSVMRALEGEKLEDLLDIGTGTGRMLEVFGPKLRRGVGVDSSREMLSIARAKLDDAGLSNCHVRFGDMYALSAPNEAFDAAVFHQVLHFAEDPVAAISEGARVLRPGGVMVIVDFAPHDLEFLRAEHAHRRLGFEDGEMVHFCAQVGLDAQMVTHLQGSELVVTIWKAHKGQNAAQVAA
ncbi:MAG: metalloregulator ArsR/SmtB family transcription factor [Sphingomonadales bacterium]|jgi:ArsR family transcriptional regulator